MTAVNWGVRLEKEFKVRGKADKFDRVNRIVPWAMIKFADVHPDAIVAEKPSK